MLVNTMIWIEFRNISTIILPKVLFYTVVLNVSVTSTSIFHVVWFYVRVNVCFMVMYAVIHVVVLVHETTIDIHW